jgi:hypothetical protein
LPLFCAFKKMHLPDFKSLKTAALKSRTILYPSRTHLYSGYCFGFLIAYISGFFGSSFRAFPAARILRRCSQGPILLGFLQFRYLFLAPKASWIFGGEFHAPDLQGLDLALKRDSKWKKIIPVFSRIG